MPKKWPSGPQFKLKELEGVVRTAAWKWPDLAPRGGPRWVRPEDMERGVSILAEVMAGRAYRRVVAKGMTVAQSRRWLLKALYHRLLDLKSASRRAELLDESVLDALPSTDEGRRRLDGLDRGVFVEKVLSQLSAAEQATTVSYFGGIGFGHDGLRISERTFKRHGAKLRKVLGGVITKAGLTRAEAKDLVVALGSKLSTSAGS